MTYSIESGQTEGLMRVTVMECGPEVLVHVASSSVVDWPTVRESLSAEVRASLTGRMTYLPARPTEGERAEGYSLCDQWSFSPAEDMALLGA